MENGTYQAYKEQKSFYSFYYYLSRATSYAFGGIDYISRAEKDLLLIQIKRGVINENVSYFLFYDETKRGAVLRTYYYIWTLVRKIVRQFATMENISISKMLDRLDVGRKVQGEYEIPTDYNQYLISESLEQIYKIIDENPQMFSEDFRKIMLKELWSLSNAIVFEEPLFIRIKKPDFPEEDDIEEIHYVVSVLIEELKMLKQCHQEAAIYAIYNKKYVDLELLVSKGKQLDDEISELTILDEELSYNLMSYESTILDSPYHVCELRKFLSTLSDPFTENEEDREYDRYVLERLYEKDQYLHFWIVDNAEIDDKFTKLIQNAMVNSYEIGKFAAKASGKEYYFEK